MRTRVIASHANSLRNSCWLLIQDNDGALHVEQQAQYANGEQKRRIVPITEFMREGGPPPRKLRVLIDRMFNEI